MDDPIVVASSSEEGDREAADIAQQQPDDAAATGDETPTQAEARCHQNVRQALIAEGLSEQTIEILASSWRDGTKSQYRTYIEQWSKFCERSQYSTFRPVIGQVLQFFTDIYKDRSLGYSAMNTARSALSTFIIIDGLPVGQHHLVKRFMKGVFNQRPALPRYNVMWDANIMLNHIKSLSPVASLTLKQLTYKLLSLMLLLSGQRGQTVHLIDIRNIDITPNRFNITIGDLTKTTRPGHHTEQLHFKAYAPNRRLCVHTVIQEYLRRTLEIRGKETRLFIGIRPPHRAISRDTLSRWVKEFMRDCGINMAIFAPHSVRSAAVSAVDRSTKVQLKTILRTAGWTTANTFTKYYKKPISENFSDGLL